MINKKEIGKRIKEARKEQNLTQKEIANELGIKQQAYSRFENGEFELDYEKIIFLCKKYKTSADYLLGLENEDGTKTYNIENNGKYINSFNNIDNFNNNKIN
jgi:transcriptional regulator with XRE-family HTH domain